MKILEEAINITEGDRRRDYDHPIYNFVRIALMWTTYKGVAFSPIDVAWMNMCTKVAREANTVKYDNLLDIVGYAKCVDDMAIFWLINFSNGLPINQENKEYAIKVLSDVNIETLGGLMNELERLKNGSGNSNSN